MPLSQVSFGGGSGLMKLLVYSGDMETYLPPCPACASQNIKKNGHQSGKQRYRCRDCHKTWRDNPNSRATDPQRKATILAAYHERMSQRGLARVFGVSRSTGRPVAQKKTVSCHR